MKLKLDKKRTSKRRKSINYSWIIVVTLCAFIISFGFSAFSELIIPNVNVVIAIFVLIFFIILGILFDMIGVAVTVGDIKSFHSMSAKKIRGARLAVSLIQNAEKVSSFCNDVIGDICGIMSGSTGITIAAILVTKLNCNLFVVTLTLTALIASLTIGGKALGKGFAMHKSNEIIGSFAKILSFFYRK